MLAVVKVAICFSKLCVGKEHLSKQVANKVQLRLLNVSRDIRMVCDASNNRLGAVLEQKGSEG